MQASANLNVPTPSIDVEENLRSYFRKNKHDVLHLEVLPHGYCQSETTLSLIENWYANEFPNLKAAATADQIKWADDLKKLAASIRAAGNYSQVNILNILAKFIEKYPTPDKEKLIKNFRNGPGHCDGMSFLVAFAFLLQHQPKNSTNAPRDDWTRVEGVYDTLLKWDGSSDLTLEQRKEILGFIRLVFSAQHSLKTLDIVQGDWHQIFADTCGRKLQEPQMMLLPFSRKGIDTLTKTVLPFVSFDNKPTTVQSPGAAKVEEFPEVQIFQLGANKHRTMIIKLSYLERGQVKYFFHDSNNMCKLMVEIKDLKIVAKIIQLCHWIDNNPHYDAFRVRVFGLNNPGHFHSATTLVPDSEIQNMDTFNKSAMMLYSVYLGNVALINFWISKGADAAYVFQGRTALQYVAAGHGAEVAKALLDKDASNIEAESPKAGMRAIHIAARTNSCAVLKVLLDKKAKVNVKMKSNAPRNPSCTPLHLASMRGNTEAVKMLLDAKANLEAETLGQETAVILAMKAKQWDTMELLIARGARFLTSKALKVMNEETDSEVQARYALYILAEAVKADLTYFIQASFRILSRTKTKLPEGLDLVFDALRSKGLKAVELLMRKNADFDVPGSDGMTTLCSVAAAGDLNMVVYLLKHNLVDVSLKANRAAVFRASNDVIKNTIKKAIMKTRLKKYREQQLELADNKSIWFKRDADKSKRVVLADKLLGVLESSTKLVLSRAERQLLEKEIELRAMVSTVVRMK